MPNLPVTLIDVVTVEVTRSVLVLVTVAPALTNSVDIEVDVNVVDCVCVADTV